MIARFEPVPILLCASVALAFIGGPAAPADETFNPPSVTAPVEIREWTVPW